MATYHLNEATFDLPDSWSDDSVNVFTGVTAEEKKINIVLTRLPMPEDRKLMDFAHEQLGQLRRQLDGFELELFDETELSEQAAVLSSFSWNDPHSGLLAQMQLYLPLPDGSRLWVFTITTPEVFSEEQRVAVFQLLASVQFRNEVR